MKRSAANSRIPGPWELMVCQAWRDAVRPEPPLQDPKWPHLQPGYKGWGGLDAEDAEKWLSGKTWEDIAGEEESWHMELEFPLYFFHPAASAYYLGGYLLEIAVALEQENSDSFGSNHFIHICGSTNFVSILHHLSLEQRALTGRLIQEMLSNRDIYRLSADTAAMLSRGLAQIIASSAWTT